MSFQQILSLLTSNGSGWSVAGFLLIIAITSFFRDTIVTGRRLRKAEDDRDKAVDLLRLSELQKTELLTLNMLIAEKMHREVPGSTAPPTTGVTA